jgi:hypothetical protein
MNYPRSKLPPLGLRSDHASPLKTLLTAFLGHLRAFIRGLASGPVASQRSQYVRGETGPFVTLRFGHHEPSFSQALAPIRD